FQPVTKSLTPLSLSTGLRATLPVEALRSFRIHPVFPAQGEDRRLLPVDLAPESVEIRPRNHQEAIEHSPVFRLVRSGPPAHTPMVVPGPRAEADRLPLGASAK